MFSADTLGLVIECLSEVVWYRRDQDRIFKVAGVPTKMLTSVPVDFGQGPPSKRQKADHVVLTLHALGPDGLGPLRSIVQQLKQWKRFELAADPERARNLVEQLGAVVEVQQEEREAERKLVDERRRQYEQTIQRRDQYNSELTSLYQRFLGMMTWEDRQLRGREFEELLYKLFLISGLQPKTPFRIVGEEIDGAFVLDYDHFLMEARWRKEKTPDADLLVLRGKVEGKFEGTRGLFISVNDYTDEAIRAIAQGKQPNLILMGGAHLSYVLEGRARLDDLLRELLRLASTTGRVWVPVSSLFS